MKNVEKEKKVKDTASGLKVVSLKKDVKSNKSNVNNDKNSVNKNTTSNNKCMFYLAQKVQEKTLENQSKKTMELDKINKLCEKEELKDRKKIEKLKEDLLAKYKREQEKAEKKIVELRKNEIERMEKFYQKEQEKIDEMCKKEVMESIKRYSEKNNWFEAAMQLYNANPDFFNKS